MLAVFHKQFAHPPQELNSPAADAANIPSGRPGGSRKPKNPQEILRDFHAVYPADSFSATFGGGAALACVGPCGRSSSTLQRLFCCFDEIYCMFVGSLHNLSSLIRQYGLSGKSTNEALLVIEAYRTLRDRGPYPADQVVKDLSGSFAFVVYDNKAGTVFAALLRRKGSAVLGNCRRRVGGDLRRCDIIKGSCGKSYAPFPTGCMFHSEFGLKSFEHPMNRMKAMPRVDSEGVMCGANFKVDTYSKVNSMPQVGSAANWTAWDNSL
uniref:DUF3700 domain-containing protein n=1 Tax=Ananas comosus var. bracteatus TaxID=296719 RepID=A0A6V7NRS0_ANACO|nr:unnamed protein product [Ananas comosus var. bracteatus]